MSNTIKKVEQNSILLNRKRALHDFSSVAHRLELICSKNNHQWINDSKSTDIGAASFSLEQVAGPVIWIVGSDGSHRDLDMVNDLVIQKVKKIICYGLFETDLKYAFGGKVQYAFKKDLAEAIQVAYDCAISKATVLFSPACSSFNNYTDFRERGDHFKSLVKAL
jgi:UDP-N-acetylmuramoylalanine--D-glutamate ligase